MITIQSLTKNFGEQRVLNRVNASFDTGKVTAIIGPNGSGKSTLIKSILGLVTPDSGLITLDGKAIAPQDAEYRRRIGYMPQTARFPENMKVHELLSLMADLRDMVTDRDEELMRSLQLEREISKALKHLSGGTKQKVNAYLAFLFRPDVLILDEPTAGLDPVSSTLLKDKILKEKNNGRTVIITSHVMSELEEITDRVLFLNEGCVNFEGTIEDLRQKTGEERLERSIAHLMKGLGLWTLSKKY
ncbi:MAG TPA: ABC transporter ATP-binding protein [bacterium]|nr:ABC transporter ATP-binding protein [bacterium]HMW34821.1 ABC transporter ATP-binding protein [bacterium]HMZ02980.1 ABC transporter ATP-binding protein [bacterium]HNB10082.1 ABC transporter ATP-binding protein [bacterium]HNB55688.1 ABC transporter ATP-binding protein [bacterium]